MAVKLKFITEDVLCSIEVENNNSELIFKIDTPELDAELNFDYETALALKNQIDLVLKIIEPVKPTK